MTQYLHPFFLIVTLLLSSCAVGPNFVRPTPTLSKNYTAKPVSHFGNQHVRLDKSIHLDWWKEFHSPTLNQMMQQGINHNYSLIAMQESLAQAKELVTATKGQLWPQASLYAGAGRQQYGAALFGPLNFTIPPFSYYEIGPSINYMLDVFGGTRRTIEKQQALALNQQYELNAAFLTVTGNIATTSLSIAAINAQIAATKDIILDDKKNLQFVQKAFDLGSSTRTAVLSAQSQFTNDKTLLPPLYQQLIIAQNTLKVLLGTDPGNGQPSTFKLKDFTLPKELPLSIPSELIHKRPDILAAEATLHAANADVGIATANLYPKINLSASLLQEGLIPAPGFSISPNAWSLLGGLTTPLFTGGTLRTQRRASIHAYQSACAKYQQVVLNAFSQVSGVLYALKHDAEEVALQKRALLTAKESVRLSRLSFDAGNTGVLDILYAERLYAQARIGYVNAKAQRYQDTIQLYLALGGGF